MKAAWFVTRLCALAIVLGSFAGASAAQVRGTPSFNVPFDFYVGKTFCPSGRYRVAERNIGVLTIQSRKQGLMSLSRTERTSVSTRHSTLVFRSVGNKRVLCEIHSANELGYTALVGAPKEHRGANRIAVIATP